jgi:HemX protein
MSSGLLLICAAAAYLIASVLYCADLLKKQKSSQGLIISGRIIGLLGVVSHTAAIGLHCARTHHTPISTGPEAFSATGWAIAITYLVLEVLYLRKAPVAVGAVAFPLAFLSVFTGSAVASTRGSQSPTQFKLIDSSLVSLHVIAIVFAFGLLTLAVCCSLLYLLEHRLLKQKRLASALFNRLPPLATIDHLAFSLVCLAFPLLSLGIAAGIIRAFSSTAPLSQWGSDAHTLSSLVCWAFYGLYLWAHATSNWQGLRSNYLLLAGLAAAVITYFAPSTLHRFS